MNKHTTDTETLNSIDLQTILKEALDAGILDLSTEKLLKYIRMRKQQKKDPLRPVRGLRLPGDRSSSGSRVSCIYRHPWTGAGSGTLKGYGKPYGKQCPGGPGSGSLLRHPHGTGGQSAGTV